MPRTPLHTERSERGATDHCQYVSPLGRKCRQLRSPTHPSFCQHHSGRPPQALNESSAAQLLGLPAGHAGQIEDFTSAAQVNQFLANLLKLTARGLIPRRDAAVLAYIAQSLLNGLAARRRELRDQQSLADAEPTEVIWDIPRPHYEDEPPPHLAPAHRQSPSVGSGLQRGPDAQLTNRRIRGTDSLDPWSEPCTGHKPRGLPAQAGTEHALLDPPLGAAYP